jgi:hypothetical protein
LDGVSARPTETQNKRRQMSMPRVGFEHTIPAFERAKTFHALDRSATGIGNGYEGDFEMSKRSEYLSDHSPPSSATVNNASSGLN